MVDHWNKNFEISKYMHKGPPLLFLSRFCQDFEGHFDFRYKGPPCAFSCQDLEQAKSGHPNDDISK